MTTYKLKIPNEKVLLKLGSRLAKACKKNAVIFLQGPLGAGKTTFARGFIKSLGYIGHVKSPTYTIVEPYELPKHPVYHFDLYRIKDPEELAFIGIQDYFTAKSICLIEWPEQGEGVLPAADLSCYIEMQGEGREVTLVAHSINGQSILNGLKNE